MDLTSCVVGKNDRGALGWFIRFPFDAEFLGEFKDCIDRYYRDWIPATKTWWVSEECGGMLAGLFENWDLPVNQPKNVQFLKRSPKCPKCNNKGYVSSTHPGVFSGKPIPNAYVDCECKKETFDYYHRIKPEDMEFPCSDTFRGFSFQISGKDDPDSAHSPEPEPVIEPVFRPRP